MDNIPVEGSTSGVYVDGAGMPTGNSLPSVWENCVWTVTGYMETTTTYTITVPEVIVTVEYPPPSYQQVTVTTVRYREEKISTTVLTPIYGMDCSVTAVAASDYVSIYETSEVNYKNETVDVLRIDSQPRPPHSNLPEDNEEYVDDLPVSGDALEVIMGGNDIERLEPSGSETPLSGILGGPSDAIESERIHKQTLQWRLDITTGMRSTITDILGISTFEWGITVVTRQQLIQLYQITSDSLSIQARQQILQLLTSGATHYRVELFDTNVPVPGTVVEY